MAASGWNRRTVVGAVTFLVGMAVAGALAPGAAQDTFLSMGTSSAGSTWFPLGGAMASVINQNVPSLRVNVEATGGNVDNVRLLGNEHIELALISSDQAYLAYNGEGPYEGKAIRNFQGLLGGGQIVWQSYSLKSHGVESIADLEGKRVSLGAPGSIGNSVGAEVLAAYGLEMRQDWQPEYLSHGDGPGALKDGRVQGVVIIGPVPTHPVTDITSTDGSDVVFLMPDTATLEGLLKKHPYWAPAEIPGGTYSGHAETIENAFGVPTILVAHESLSEDAAYAIVKALLENQEDLRAGHALGAEWVPETATRGIKGVIPFHPGAERYLRERGLLD